MNNLKSTLLRYRAMELHYKLVRTGEYLEAQRVLKLLINQRVYLSLSDVDFRVEIKLKHIGCDSSYTSRMSAIMYLRPKQN